MRVLVACEQSGRVRDAFRARGHDAWSCDVKESSGKTLGDYYPHLYPRGHALACQRMHFQCNVFDILPGGRTYQTMMLEGQQIKWDLLIAHPDCTYLTNSAAWAYKAGPYHMKVKPGTLVGAARRQARADAYEFFMALWNCDIPRICIENPAGYMSTSWREPDQYIQPNWFGDDASKRTGLWLKNLPKLTPTLFVEPRYVDNKPRWANQTDSGQNRLSPSDSRAAARAETYPGIAAAFAEQWGGL